MKQENIDLVINKANDTIFNFKDVLDTHFPSMYTRDDVKTLLDTVRAEVCEELEQVCKEINEGNSGGLKAIKIDSSVLVEKLRRSIVNTIDDFDENDISDTDFNKIINGNQIEFSYLRFDSRRMSQKIIDNLEETIDGYVEELNSANGVEVED